MFAKFGIRRERRVRVFAAKHMLDVALPVFCRGPEYAATIAMDLPETISADFSEVGFYLDFPRKVALLYDDGVCWDPQVAQATGRVLGPASRAAGFERLDLYPQEEALKAAVLAAKTFAELEAAIRAHGFLDSWDGWQIHWGTGADFRAAVARPLPRQEG